jgi:hypothetical protein
MGSFSHVDAKKYKKNEFVTYLEQKFTMESKFDMLGVARKLVKSVIHLSQKIKTK